MHVCVDYKDQAGDYVLGSWCDGLDSLVEKKALEHWLSSGEPNKKGISGVKEIMSPLNLMNLFSGDFIADWEGDTSVWVKLDANAEALLGAPEVTMASAREAPLSFGLV
ncbi:MAG: hypothetical protein WA950_06910 [Shinella sp.]|uniref:hypothetical protein n=1 Tax=Shinella sp. TaxID=1870904 RepID=UPI003C75CFBE